MEIKKVLSIAGFDPTGWAGVLADCMVFFELGAAPLAVPTALTVQDLLTVTEVNPVEAGILSRQLKSILQSPPIEGVKIGMLGSGEGAAAVAEALQKASPPVIVLDPVFASTAGTPLIDDKGLEVIKKSLIPLSTLLTPNMREASILTGDPVEDTSGMRRAAEKIVSTLRAKAVLVKGGHLTGEAIDILYDGSEFREFKGARLEGPKALFHGTGCLLSSAITVKLAKGASLKEAVRESKDFTKKILLRRREFF